MLNIGVIGCGTIGGEICKAIDKDIVRAELTGICDIDLPKANNLALSLKKCAKVMNQAELIRASELVIEAVSKAAAPGIIRETLGCSRDVLVMSVGGLLECVDEVLELAKSKGRRIYVPSGAIAGLDAVKAAIGGPSPR
jgi:aspartate dehydrogenase